MNFQNKILSLIDKVNIQNINKKLWTRAVICISSFYGYMHWLFKRFYYKLLILEL